MAADGGCWPASSALQQWRRQLPSAPCFLWCCLAVPGWLRNVACSYSPQLNKWIEVGNSGMFRPEMLRPMGIPEDVNVIAWGLGLER